MAGGITKREGVRGVTYQATVEGPRAIDGTRRQFRKSFTRRKDAVEWRTKTLHELREGSFVRTSQEPTGAYLNRWLEIKTRLAPSTRPLQRA